MSYKDFEAAKAKRDAKEAAVVKGKPGRKRKSSAPGSAGKKDKE
jgi:hypothetical protein